MSLRNDDTYIPVILLSFLGIIIVLYGQGKMMENHGKVREPFFRDLVGTLLLVMCTCLFECKMY